LRGGYQPQELYALRVGMRRIRSMLKPLTNTRARRFRKAWGGFAAVTNRARDWDVFLLAARDILPARAFATFEAANAKRVSRCHEDVMELLQSAPWRRHLQEWRGYLDHSNNNADGQSADPVSLEQAVDRAHAALAAALRLGDDRSWHKLRIAVKEVRYQAESGPGGLPQNDRQSELIEECKPLQALLGGWHDCVVQLQLLEELPSTPHNDRLREVIDEKRKEDLEAIERSVSGHPLFEPSGSFATRARSDSSSGS
jgi:CHAD domain-containing protein